MKRWIAAAVLAVAMSDPQGCEAPDNGGGGNHAPKSTRDTLDIYVTWGYPRQVFITTRVDGVTHKTVSQFHSPYHYHQDIGWHGSASVEAHSANVTDRIGLECEIRKNGWTYDQQGPNARKVECKVNDIEEG